MIYVDDTGVKVDSTALPGLFKKIEIQGDVIVDEQEVEGQTKKPKQATGYEDIKVFVELTLDEGEDQTAMEKLTVIQNLFRKPGQDTPEVRRIVNEHTAACGVDQVIFKKLTHTKDSARDRISVTMEFWEYTYMGITATKSTGSARSSVSAGAASSQTSNVGNGFLAYLENRGTSPYKSPAQDTADPSRFLNKIGDIPLGRYK